MKITEVTKLNLGKFNKTGIWVKKDNWKKNKLAKEETCIAYLVGVDNCYCKKCVALKKKTNEYLNDMV